MRWVLGKLPMPRKHLAILREHAARNGWSSTMWLTKSHASFAPLRNGVHTVGLRPGALPIELELTMGDLIAEVGGPTPSPIFPVSSLSSAESMSLFEAFPLPTDHSKVCVLHSAPTNAASPLEWKAATKAEVLIGSTLQFLPTVPSTGGRANQQLLSRNLFLLSQAAAAHQNIPRLSQLVQKPQLVQVFNAEQTIDPFALDSSICPVNPAASGAPWTGAIGQTLAATAVQMKYTSHQWIEVRARDLATLKLKPGAHPPHLAVDTTPIKMIHISAFPVRDQLIIYDRLPYYVRNRRTFSVCRTQGLWHTVNLKRACEKRVIEDVTKLGLNECQGQKLAIILRNTILISEKDLAALHVPMPEDGNKYSLLHPLNTKRLFVNRDQLVDPQDRFDKPFGGHIVAEVKETPQLQHATA